MARRLLACLVALLGIVWIATPLPALAAGAKLEVTITSVGDPVLAPGAPLRVSATVTNRGSGPTTITSASLKAQPRAPISRGELLRFVTGSDAALRTVSTTTPDDKAATLAPGAHTDIQFQVQPTALAWPASDWGPHGVQVSVAADRQTEMDRSIVVLAPGSVARAPAGVVVPVVASASEIGELEPFAMGRQPRGDSGATAERLGALLSAIGQPGVIAAVDPLLGKAGAAGAGGPDGSSEAGKSSGSGASAAPAPSHGNSATPNASGAPSAPAATGPAGAPAAPPASPASPDGPSPQSTARIRAALDAFARTDGTETIYQPAGDADVAALAHAHSTEADDLLAASTQAAQAEARARGARADITLVAPNPDLSGIRALASKGTAAIVIGQHEGTPLSATWWTPQAQTRVRLSEGKDMPALAADPDLSAAFAGRATSAGTSVTLSALDSRQLVLGLSASAYRERPSDQRAQLITVDRPDAALWGPTSPEAASAPGAADAVSALAPANMGATISALMNAPWIQPSTVSEMLQQAKAAADRQDTPAIALPDSESSKGEITPDQIRVARGALRAVAAMDSATAPSHLFGEEATSSTLRTLGVTFREAPEERSLAVTEASQAGARISQSVYVRPSSPINVIAENTELPVHVANDLPVAVTVDVHLRARDLRVAASKVTRVVIPPHSTANAKIPVRASGSGDVTAVASITTPRGDAVGRPQDIHVRVRATWENTGLIAGGTLVGLVLVVGLVRSVRGGRRSRSVDPEHAPRETPRSPRRPGARHQAAPGVSS